MSTSGGSALLPLVEAFERRYPACRVNVVDIPLTQGVEPLRRGDVAVADAMRLPVTQPDLSLVYVGSPGTDVDVILR